MAQTTSELSAVVAQPVSAPLTRAAIFLVVTINPGARQRAAVRSLCADLAALLRAVGFRDIEARPLLRHGDRVGCLGPAVWPPRPAELHPFREIRAGPRHAVATPGDLLFHIRAKRMDLCFELATQIMARLGDAVTRGRRGARLSLLRRPRPAWASSTARRIRVGQAAIDAALIGEEDAAFAGGSYVIVQKYLHDLGRMERAADRGAGTHHRPHQALRHRAGRRGQADLRAQRADHDQSRTARESRSCATTCRSAGLGSGEFGTYFIGYSRSPRTIEQMLENMFIGRPPGNYDRLLDFSRAVTGNLFFVPSATFLDARERDDPPCRPPPPRRRSKPSPSDDRRRGRLARHRLAQRRSRPMNNLHRELAPISDAAWAQIEEEATRTLKRYLAGRRVVDVKGPAATAFPPSAPATCKTIAAPDEGILARQREVKPLVELRASRSSWIAQADRRRRAGRERLRLAAGEGRGAKDRLCRGPRDLRGLRRRRHRGHAAGHEQPDHDACRPTCAQYPDAIAQALSQLASGRRQRALFRAARRRRLYGAVARPATTAIRCWSTSSGWSTTRSSGRPAIDGAFVLTTRGGDFDLHIGQDVSIGYLSHDDSSCACTFRKR